MSATGKKILQAATGTVKRTHLELGGKAPVIVFDDADLAAVVERPAHLRLLQRRPGLHRRLPRLRRRQDLRQAGGRPVAARSRPSRSGLPDEPDVEIGPLISDRQRNRVASFVERAPMAGHMEITAGGKARAGSGFFYEPTVVAGARQEDEIVQARGLRPGGQRHPLHRRRAGHRLGQRQRLRPGLIGLDAGRVARDAAWPRSCNTAAPGSTPTSCCVNEMPHGGLKSSGYGKDMGMYALEDYTVPRHVMVKL